jgi:hypothetical protein
MLVVATCRLDTLLVLPRGALLCVTPSLPDTLRDSAATGSATQRSNTVSIENCGAGLLRWRAFPRHGSPWLSIQPDSGLVGSGSESPNVVFNSATLDTGVYHETIVVNSTTGSGAVEVPVRFYIHPCRITQITIDDSAVATLTSADCGAPHRSGGYARIYGFPGTANDSVSIELPASFDAYLTLDTTVDRSRPPLAETDDCLGFSGDPCLYYQRLPFNASYFVEVTSADSADTGSFTLHLVHPRLPRPPVSLDQRLSDSVTSIAPGATVNYSGILLRAVISDPDLGDSVHLEAEVRPVAIAFSGPNVPDGPAVGNGQPAWASVVGLTDNAAYHWRVRAGDNTGRWSPWVSFGGTPDFVVNVLHPPNPPTTLGQATGDGTGILIGATIDTDVVILSASVSDPDPGDLLRLEVEVRPVGTPFSAPTGSSAPVSDGGPLQVMVGPLPNATSYHWRARAIDQLGDTSSWVAYGGNPESATDFRIVVPHVPNPPDALAQLQSSDLSPIPVGGAASSNTIVISGVVSDPDAGQSVQLEVEVLPVGQDFIGQANYVTPLAPSNSTVSATVGPLAFNTNYHWQARAKDAAGGTGAWVPFPISPTNPETAPDFSYQIQQQPVQLVFTVQPTNTRVGRVIKPAIQVTAQDITGQTSTSFGGTVTMTLETNPGFGTLSGTTTVTAVAGVATFADLSIDRTGFGYQLRATTVQPALTAVSAPFNITRRFF